jgi:hypothetical protein
LLDKQGPATDVVLTEAQVVALEKKHDGAMACGAP